MYTDGSALGNPGPGGYGVVLMSGPYRKELSCGYAHTTNNRMELMAVIAGLEALKNDGCDVTVYSDSKYVVDAVAKGWVFGWERKGFKDKKIPTCGGGFSPCTGGITCVSSGLRGTPKFLKTSDATGWPWLLRRRAT